MLQGFKVWRLGFWGLAILGLSLKSVQGSFKGSTSGSTGSL